ncbi:hypothetical protein [Methanoregula sp.]|uniref:hypothetical protein n=1 Tax=Methanoregula sp. TaxID=2052170 RepID=UPI000CBE852E|nr:hypothetical protein [Methanoregula sp.]PKG33467.1 MAG: hypothetical protein CW742_02830 [Methanoregula sp.]
MKPAQSQFTKEIRHFSLVTSANLIIGAVASAAGILYIIAAVLGLTAGHVSPELRVIAGAIAMVCFGLGVSVFHITLGISRGQKAIRDQLERESPAVSDERLTCLIVQMAAYYRDIRKTLGTIILIGPLCGLCVFVLGIVTGLEAFSLTTSGFSVTLDSRVMLLAQAITLAIVVSSLLSSHYVTRFATAWNHRIAEIEASECALKMTLGLDDQ